MVIQGKKSSAKHRGNKIKKYMYIFLSFVPQVPLAGVLLRMCISFSWEKWQLKFHWSEIEGVTVSRDQLCLRRGTKKKELYSEDITPACLDVLLSVCAFTCTK